MSWTDERIEQLREMWQKGLTASQIADELGGVSRNAVIGKAHRLELKSRPSPVKPSGAKAGGTGSDAGIGAPFGGSRSAAPAKPKSVPGTKSDASQTKSTPNTPVAMPSPPPRPVATPVAADASPDSYASSDASASGDQAQASAPGETAAEASSASPSQPIPGQAARAQRIVSIGPGGFIRQGPGDQQPPIPPAPPRRRVPAKASPDITGMTSLLELSDRICRWPVGHPGEPDFHFCGQPVNPGFPYCVDHCGRAYQAQLPRGTRRPPPPPPFGGTRVR